VEGRREPLRLWNLKTGAVRSQSYVASGAQALALSRDARYAVTAGADKVIRLWETSTGKELQQFRGHAGPVLTVALSEDGARVLSGGADKTVRVWDARTGKELHRYAGHEGAVTCVTFSPDGRYAASGSMDKTLCLWQVQRGAGNQPAQGTPEPKGKKQPVDQQNELSAGGRFVRQDQLIQNGPRDTVRRNMYARTYTIHFQAGKTYQIDMVSNQIDPYLRLEDVAGRQLAEDDDGGGFPNARISFSCRQTGNYRIVCTTFDPNQVGAFALTVREARP
jgi:WD40 repeat protein